MNIRNLQISFENHIDGDPKMFMSKVFQRKLNNLDWNKLFVHSLQYTILTHRGTMAIT